MIKIRISRWTTHWENNYSDQPLDNPLDIPLEQMCLGHHRPAWLALTQDLFHGALSNADSASVSESSVFHSVEACRFKLPSKRHGNGFGNGWLGRDNAFVNSASAIANAIFFAALFFIAVCKAERRISTLPFRPSGTNHLGILYLDMYC